MTRLSREEALCGLGSVFRPKWIQIFATTRSFLFVYGLLGTVQAMSYVYFIATLTTVEKRFRIPSKTTGLMLSGNEISQILLSLLLSYYGGQRNRPLWIAWGVAFSATSCFVLALPHFLYGPGDTALSLTQEYIASHGINSTVQKINDKLGVCSEESKLRDCEVNTGGEYSSVPPLLIFLSQFILGIGTTLYYSLGQTYIDDNTKKTNTPMLLGITLSLRTIGPVFGFIMGFAFLKLYIDPSLTPIITNEDARWLGAWWIGWLVLGAAMLLFAVLIALFPKHLPPSSAKPKLTNNTISPITTNEKEMIANGNTKLAFGVEENQENKPKAPTLQDFPKALKRLMKNKLLIINIFSGVFYILGGSGYITYMTKYLEVQFQRTAAGANIIIGPITLITMVLGFIISGWVISKFQPRPKYLLGWNVVIGIIYVIGEFSLLFVSCDDHHLVGFNKVTQQVTLINSCNVECNCDNLKYAPVCFKEAELTFYTACHAGCRTFTEKNDTKLYNDCACVPGPSISFPKMTDIGTSKYRTGEPQLTDGACKVKCGNSFLMFVIIAGVMNSLGSSGKIGNILVNYRAVKPEDKSFAQGLTLLTISLFAFIPGPIIFGALIDSSCLIWDEGCGSKGNCWMYDKHAFRYKVNLTAAALTSLGVILDVIVCYLGTDLVLYDDEDQLQGQPNQEPQKIEPAS